VLWGGIAQDYLLDLHNQQDFETAVRQARQEVKGDRRMILGIADRVPVDAKLDRLLAVANLVRL